MAFKVVQINGLDKMGGSARVSYTLHKEYLKRGYESSVLVGQKFSDESYIKEIKGRYKNRFIDRYSRILGIKDLLPINNSDLFVNDFYKEADLLHLHNLHGGYFNLRNLVKISFEKPTVWTLHDMWAFTANSPHTFDCNRWVQGEGCNCGRHNGFSTKIFEKAILEFKKKIYSESIFTIVVPSLWMKSNVDKSILKDKRVEIIYNGIDEKNFSPIDQAEARRILNLPKDKEIICFAAHGGLKNKWKGGEYLKEAWKIIQKRKNTILLEIGVDKEDISKNANHIKVPYISDPKKMAMYYSASDIFLFSSLGESSSLVCMEALACGLPVVSFDVGPLKEIVKDGENGLLVKYKDSIDLAKKTLLLLNDNSLYRKLSSNARSSILRSYTFDKQVRAYLKLYQDLCNNEI